VEPQPPATARPQGPVFEFFEINPKTIVLGDAEPVKLSWSIKGDLSAVEIFSPDLQLTTSLTRSGTIPIFPEQSTFFIMTAINREQSSTAQVEITVDEPTPTPTGTLPPTPTGTPLPTATSIPRPGIVFFGADSGDTPPSPDKVQLIRSD